MRVLFSLGNPGLTYEGTRHSVGHAFLDFLVDFYFLPPWSLMKKASSFRSFGVIENEEFCLLKSSDFMNLSGQALRLALSYWKISLEDVCVIADDLDQDFGRFKIKEKGSSGGHRGLENIILKLQTESFKRLKIGIGRPRAQMPISHWVLTSFSQEEEKALREKIFPEAQERLFSFLRSQRF